MVKNKVIIITQARVASTRLPGKVLKEINGTSLLSIHLNQLKKAKAADAVVLATTNEEGAGKIVEIGNKAQVSVYQGSTDDVLDRFYQAVKNMNPQFVVRVTSDCPLIDPQLIDEVVEMTISQDLDYGANILEEHFPDGQDVEVLKFSALERAWKEAKLQSEREHVTPFIRNNSDYKGGNIFKAANYPAPDNFNHIRMTVDEPADFEAVEHLIDALGTDAGWKAYTEYVIRNPERFINQKIIRNEGLLKSLQKESNI